MLKKIAILFLFTVAACRAGLANDSAGPANSPPAQVQTNQDSTAAAFQRAEKQRQRCIEGRRLICGKILQVLPTGLVVESGYTNLLREPLVESWLAPKTVSASRAENLLEEKKPGAICIGLVFLTDYPKSKRLKPSQYDYVMIEAYPAGQFVYHSVGTIERSLRRFSGGLDSAIKLNLESAKATAPAPRN
jgi:hypothetical protein